MHLPWHDQSAAHQAPHGLRVRLRPWRTARDLPVTEQGGSTPSCDERPSPRSLQCRVIANGAGAPSQVRGPRRRKEALVDGLISAAFATVRRAGIGWAPKDVVAAVQRATKPIQVLLVVVLVTVTMCLIALLIALFVAFAQTPPDVRHDVIEFVRVLRGEPRA
jgi:hypothetical protein